MRYFCTSFCLSGHQQKVCDHQQKVHGHQQKVDKVFLSNFSWIMIMQLSFCTKTSAENITF